MANDSIAKYIEIIKSRIEGLKNISFNGKVVIEVDVKDGGITGIKYCPNESIKI